MNLDNFSIIKDLRLIVFKYKWKKKNKHNYTSPTCIFNINKVSVGKYTYGPLNVMDFGDNNESLEIGNYCSIASNVTFLLGGEHNYKYISTYPFKKKILKDGRDSYTKGKIIIEDDVWIGYGTLILSGVTIGQGSVIGAGSVVTKDIPPYSIYAGNKIIKQRFNNAIIEKIKNINYSKFDIEKIQEFQKLLYTECNSNNIDDIINHCFKK